MWMIILPPRKPNMCDASLDTITEPKENFSKGPMEEQEEQMDYEMDPIKKEKEEMQLFEAKN